MFKAGWIRPGRRIAVGSSWAQEEDQDQITNETPSKAELLRQVIRHFQLMQRKEIKHNSLLQLNANRSDQNQISQEGDSLEKFSAIKTPTKALERMWILISNEKVLLLVHPITKSINDTDMAPEAYFCRKKPWQQHKKAKAAHWVINWLNYLQHAHENMKTWKQQKHENNKRQTHESSLPVPGQYNHLKWQKLHPRVGHCLQKPAPND